MSKNSTAREMADKYVQEAKKAIATKDYGISFTPHSILRMGEVIEEITAQLIEARELAVSRGEIQIRLSKELRDCRAECEQLREQLASSKGD